MLILSNPKLSIKIYQNSYNQIWLSDPISGFLEIKIEVQNSLRKDALKAWLRWKIPLFLDDLKGYVFVWRASFKGNQTMVRAFHRRKIILWSLLLVKEVRVENGKFISLYHFRRWVIFSEFILLVPVVGYSNSIQINRFSIPKSSFCFDLNPIVKLFFILFHSFVFFKL